MKISTLYGMTTGLVLGAGLDIYRSYTLEKEIIQEQVLIHCFRLEEDLDSCVDRELKSIEGYDFLDIGAYLALYIALPFAGCLIVSTYKSVQEELRREGR